MKKAYCKLSAPHPVSALCTTSALHCISTLHVKCIAHCALLDHYMLNTLHAIGTLHTISALHSIRAPHTITTLHTTHTTNVETTTTHFAFVYISVGLCMWLWQYYTTFTHSCMRLASQLARTFVCLCLYTNELFSHAYEYLYVRIH